MSFTTLLTALTLWPLLVLQAVAQQIPEVPENLTTRTLTLQEFRLLPNRDDYVPVTPDLLSRRTQSAVDLQLPEFQNRPAGIRSARYRAEFSNQSLVGGTMLLEINREVTEVMPGPLPLGRTNLEGLTFVDGNEETPVGASRDRNLFVLKSGGSSELVGNWNAAGAVTGDTVTFRLELPSATAALLELQTALNIDVSCSNGLVVGPEQQGDKLLWLLYPAAASRLSFSCTQRQITEQAVPLSLTSVTASHVINPESMTSRWTVGLPAEPGNRTRLQLSFPASVRITDVLVNENTTSGWQTVAAGDQQQITIELPPGGSTAVIGIAGISSSPSSGSWPLPLLTPVAWSSDAPLTNGPVLMPVSQISVTIPRTMEIDGWTLNGIQERDVIPGADDTRVCQLTRFASNASATLHASGNQPRLAESIVTRMASSGRISTARCIVMIQCEQAPAVQIDWLLAKGWEPVTVRNLSTRRSLFFETRSDSPNDQPILRVHLPVPLDPATSQLLELTFQRPELTDAGITDIPAVEITGGRRVASFLIMPSSPDSSPLVQLLRSLDTPITAEDFQKRVPWFPLASPSEDSESHFDILGKSPFRSLTAVPTESQAPVEVIYRMTVQDGSVRQLTRITFPEGSASAATFRFRATQSVPDELKWTVNGVPCSAIPDDSQSGTGVRAWQLPPEVVPVDGGQVVVTAELATQIESDPPAAIVLPDVDREIRGQAELVAPAELSPVIEGLEETRSARPVGNTADAALIRTFRLPENLRPFRIRIGTTQRIHSGETINSHVFHIINEKSSALSHEVLAVSRIRRTGEETFLPLSISPDLRPVAIVDGNRVQLTESSDGLAIPLPSSRAECDVILAWNEPAQATMLTASPLKFHEVFEQKNPSQQTTHHFLVSPEIELKSPGIPWSTSAPANASEMLNRISASSGMTARVTPLGFLTRWTLFSSLGWQHRTVAESASVSGSGVVYLTSLNLRRALMYGICVLSVSAGLAFLSPVIRHRRLWAMIVMILAVVRIMNSNPVADAVIAGTFWGLSAALVVAILVSLMPVHNVPSRAATSAAVEVLAILLLTATSATASAQSPDDVTPPSSAPDLLILEDGVPNGPGTFLRRELHQQWMKLEKETDAQIPDVLITSQSTRIEAISKDSVEATLTMEVAAVTSRNESQLVIPLQGCRVVECRINGVPILPSSGEDDSVVIPVPASVLIPSRSIGVSSPSDEFIAAPAPAASWDVHRIECTLRPVVQTEESGLQFRLPALPSHRGKIEFTDSQNLIRRAFVQTGTAQFEWTSEDKELLPGSLITSEGIDVRLFFAAPQANVTENASAEILAICDTSGSQLAVNCICRISGWNPLVHRITCQLPQGFEVLSVSSSSFGELYWSRIESGVVVELFGPGKDSFDLEVRLQAASPVESGVIALPIADLIRLENCQISPQTLIAVRTSAEFSNKPTANSGNPTEVAFPSVQESFGSLLKRSDALFRVPSSTPVHQIRLVPRTSSSTVRVSQDVTCGEQSLDWTFTADVETTILPLFRHAVEIASGIEIIDVQVVALEANRLDRWHQRNNQLLIQLKEGTIGTHKITIRGRQKLNPADSEYQVLCPQLRDVQILESALTLQDKSESGFLIAETGGAVPDQLLEKNQIMNAGQDFRFQVVDESSPVLLRRRKALPRAGRIVTYRDQKSTRLLIHFEDFGRTEESRFSLPPGILAEHIPSARSGDVELQVQLQDGELSWTMPLQTAASPEEGSDLPPVPLTIQWQFPTPTDAAISVNELISLPQFPFPVQWNEALVMDADRGLVGSESSASTSRIPPDVLSMLRAFDSGISGSGVSIQSIPQNDIISGNLLRLPSRRSRQSQNAESTSRIFVLCDTTLRAAPHESVFAETEYVMFCPKYPARQAFDVPEGIFVTRVDSDYSIRWENAERTRLSVELTQPVSRIKIRWLGTRSQTSVLSTQIQTRVPVPVNSELRHVLSLHCEDSRLSIADNSDSGITRNEFAERVVQYAREGFLRSLGPANSTPAESRFMADQIQRLHDELQETRFRFLREVVQSATADDSLKRFDLSNREEFNLRVPRLPSPGLMLPYLICAAFLGLTFLSRSKTAGPPTGQPSSVSVAPPTSLATETPDPSQPFLGPSDPNIPELPASSTVLAEELNPSAPDGNTPTDNN
ncbi:MAG: hypothetical protein JNL58_21595 [Planctomyces sp.]|nr:hypothetical protein [Planctomyces sp.]